MARSRLDSWHLSGAVFSRAHERWLSLQGATEDAKTEVATPLFTKDLTSLIPWPYSVNTCQARFSSGPARLRTSTSAMGLCSLICITEIIS